MSISATTTGDPNTDLLRQITRYIPSEVIALYVAAFVFLDPLGQRLDKNGKALPVHQSDFGSRWLFAAIFVLLVSPLLVRAVFWHRAWKDGTAKNAAWKRQRRYSSVFAMLSLSAWITALPENPLQDFAGFKAGMGSLALLVMSIALGFVAGPLGLTNFTPTPTPTT